jgi:hypothetical protein
MTMTMPAFDCRRVREISNKGGRKNIGKFPSLKLGRIVWWESLLERDFIYLLEFDGDVLSYAEQPFRIRYTLNGKRNSYTPDFSVNRKNKRQIVEVKLGKKAGEEHYVILFRIIAAICLNEGYEFVVATECDIRVQPRLDNIKLLWRYAKTPIHSYHHLLCREYFKSASASISTRLIDLISFFNSKGIGRDAVYAMLYRGVISTDLKVPLEETSVVRLSYPPAH